MTRLLFAEARRIAARRLVRLTVVLVVAGIAIGGIVAFATTSALSQPAYEARVRDAESRQRAQNEQVQSCLLSHNVEPDKFERIPDDVARACFPDRDFRAHDPRFHRTRLEGILRGTSGILAIIGWALGASLVGAEFASRSMTTSLMWETRRMRLFLAKASVVLAATALFAFGALVALALAMLPALTAHGAPPQGGDPSFAAFAGIVARGTALATVGAGMGFALATIGRNTAAALGVGFGYIIVLENILGSSIASWRRWLLLGNVIVFVSGTDNAADIPGRTVVGAGVFLAAVTLALMAGALGAFRARDIA